MLIASKNSNLLQTSIHLLSLCVYDEARRRFSPFDRVKVVMIIPPELGYGEKGAGDGAIPGGATLYFIATLDGLVRLVLHICVIEPFSAILPYFQIMSHEFCVFCMEPLQPTQGSWLVPLEPPKSPKRGPF